MLIGITGGIGMGKSTVLRDFAALGCRTMDADDIAHSLYARGSRAWTAMVDRWGRGILQADGEIDRRAVGGRVFGSRTDLQWLNGLLHPLIREELRVSSCGGEPVYCAVPLLYESGWEGDAAAVVCVWCSVAVQHERLKGRGWDDVEIERRLKSQMRADEKLLRADYGILTACSWGQLSEQCRLVHEAVLAKKAAIGRQEP